MLAEIGNMTKYFPKFTLHFGFDDSSEILMNIAIFCFSNIT